MTFEAGYFLAVFTIYVATNCWWMARARQNERNAETMQANLNALDDENRVLRRQRERLEKLVATWHGRCLELEQAQSTPAHTEETT